MSAARLTSPMDADFVEVGEQRVGDRRRTDRRAPRMRLDPLFAATLINHIAAKETPAARAYPGTAQPQTRSGIIVNLSA